MPLHKRTLAEFFGTFWLVFGGCGAAVLAAGFPEAGFGFLGVALAFGLTVLTMAFAIGHVSGCHLNPAVSIGLATARRFPWREVPAYALSQVVGAIAATIVLYFVASGSPTYMGGLAANGYGIHSPGGYSAAAGFTTEVVLTFFFVFVILGASDKRAPAGFAPIAIGLALTGVHLVGIPVTNMSVNPARSTGPALIEGGWAAAQLWMFWVAPLVGAIIAGTLHPALMREPSETLVEAETAASMT